jgi:3-hydroxyacyl-[acyl-carrier-protein] dehydratase
MSFISIPDAIPHRGPMLLLDEVLSCTADTIVCRKTFRGDEFFLQGHFPRFPLVPGVILCECAMQAGGVLIAQRLGGAGGVPVATRMDQVRFRRMIRPGETIEIAVQLRDQVSQAYYLDARVRCAGQLAARLEFACTLAASEDQEMGTGTRAQ